jgi:spoIIIJ-associated protein
MSQHVDFEGKTVEKALKSASQELNQPTDKIEYDILSHGSSGIFGLVGAKKAKIRVKVNHQQLSSTIHQEARQYARDLVKDAFDIEDQEPENIPEYMNSAAKIGHQALERMAKAISSETTIDTQKSAQRIIYKINGGNSGILIGKRGQTLEALQYLVEKIVNKQSEKRIRILVDVKGYLQNRKSNLQKMATRMADKAKKINKPVTIGQMNAHDRRIVHMHLKSVQGVRTQSVGEGYYRKLVIFPKRRRQKAQHRNYN